MHTHISLQIYPKASNLHGKLHFWVQLIKGYDAGYIIIFFTIDSILLDNSEVAIIQVWVMSLVQDTLYIKGQNTVYILTVVSMTRPMHNH